MRSVAIALVVGSAVTAPVAQQTSVPADPARHAQATIALADEVVAAIKRHYPAVGTFLGLPDADHSRITDNSLEARAKRRAEEDGWRVRLAAIEG